jgi:hypothetical protein
MSRLLLTIDTDGDAFRDNGWQHEAAQVLKNLAAVLAFKEARDAGGTLRDTSGLSCGAWDYEPDEP